RRPTWNATSSPGNSRRGFPPPLHRRSDEAPASPFPEDQSTRILIRGTEGALSGRIRESGGVGLHAWKHLGATRVGGGAVAPNELRHPRSDVVQLSPVIVVGGYVPLERRIPIIGFGEASRECLHVDQRLRQAASPARVRGGGGVADQSEPWPSRRSNP